MNIGLELKNLRKKSKLTQLELAQKCNLSKNAIWNYENNKRDPTRATLTKIGEALGVDLGYLLSNSKPVINEELANDLHDLGFSSEIMKNVECSKEDALIVFNRFLASANLPFDIPMSELESLYDKTKDFLEFEFFKLGYVRVSDNE